MIKFILSSALWVICAVAFAGNNPGAITFENNVVTGPIKLQFKIVDQSDTPTCSKIIKADSRSTLTSADIPKSTKYYNVYVRNVTSVNVTDDCKWVGVGICNPAGRITYSKTSDQVFIWGWSEGSKVNQTTCGMY